MGNHDYDPNLLRALDDLDLPGVPVEKGEWNRVLASARGQVNAKQPGRKARRSRPLLRLVRSAAVAAAACVVVLGSVNLANPAFAESQIGRASCRERV